MATKRRTRSKNPPKSGPSLGQFLKGEIAGSVLVLLAILIFLSLVSSSRGEITEAAIAGLRFLFGAGVWLVPFLIAGLGVWLALRDVTEGERWSAWRIVGAFGLFAASTGFAHLFAGMPDVTQRALEGQGGGLLGWFLSGSLVGGLGPVVGGVLLLIVLLLSLVALAGRSFADISAGLSVFWGRLLRRPEDAPLAPAPRINGRGMSSGPDRARINPPLPLGEPREPNPFVRLWRKIVPEKETDLLPPWDPPHRGPVINGGRAAPVAPRALPPVANGTPAAGATAAASARPGIEPMNRGTTRPAGGPLQPRIIGGTGQTWRVPPVTEILDDVTDADIQQEDLRRRVQIIEQTLQGFGVPVSVVEVNQGPAVTQFGLRPGTIIRKDRKGEEKHIKVRVSQIQALSNDLSLALAASPIRIEAPVPGRDFVGIEVPNMQISLVSLRGVMESEEWPATKGLLKFGLGRDVSGQASVADLARMPHLLIAGATGSGKSVCVNTIITSLLLTHTPDTLRFLMVDPKRVELTVYNGIPHLIAPVVVDVERAVPVLQWATKEMERRYKLFAKMGARNIEAYNDKLHERGEQALPYIVIIIDELADLMLSAPEDVERYICRIAQMARATGMHLIIATQRPSVDVVTGLIKANFPARVAFAVTSQIDSRVILDTPGAEQLLGRGDMLFMAPDQSKLQRLQGCFVSDRESARLVQYWRGMRAFSEPTDLMEGEAPLLKGGEGDGQPQGAQGESEPAGEELQPPWLPGQETLQQPLWEDVAASEAEGKDDLYRQAVEEVRKSGRASISLLQRRLRIGYSRAARLIDQMEADGIIGPEQGGTRGRDVLPGK
jgi:DNA segregation ATPase FtsK/SpoIIIE, S-DNA-T family